MVRHLTVPRESPRRLLRTLNHGFYIGRGQATRVFISRGKFRSAFRGLDRVVMVLAHFGLAAICGWAAWRSVWWPAILWVAVSVAGFVLFAVRVRSFARAAFYVTEWTLQGACLFMGLMVPWRPADQFRWEGEERDTDNTDGQGRQGALLA